MAEWKWYQVRITGCEPARASLAVSSLKPNLLQHSRRQLSNGVTHAWCLPRRVAAVVPLCERGGDLAAPVSVGRGLGGLQKRRRSFRVARFTWFLQLPGEGELPRQN